MRHAGRAASVAEKQRVLDDVAAVEADSSQADATLQVRCSLLPTAALSSEHPLFVRSLPCMLVWTQAGLCRAA